MASDPSAPNPPPGGLQSMLDRLKGLTRSLSNAEPEEEILPTFDVPTPAAPAAVPVEAVPAAIPVEPLAEAVPEAVPAAEPVPEAAVPAQPEAPPDFETETPTPEPPEPPVPSPPAPPARCPVCGSERMPGHASCADCGFHFPGDALATAAPVAGGMAMRVKQRYEIGELLSERGGVSRFRGRDLGLSGTENVPVVIVR
ncbi:MAG TPA: hypothetical protein VKD72_33670, partial [Gemmataceae bacterium]|nr:hypothetical protein [Gemmataceae bacterium]